MIRGRLALALAGAIALASCGGNPASPATSINIAGAWTGSFQYQTAGVTVTDDATLTVAQSSTAATGTWSTSGLSSGSVSLTPSASFAGTLTISQTNVGSSPCTGSSTISGTASATDLVFTVADLAQTPACPWATGMKFTLHK